MYLVLATSKIQSNKAKLPAKPIGDVRKAAAAAAATTTTTTTTFFPMKVLLSSSSHVVVVVVVGKALKRLFGDISHADLNFDLSTHANCHVGRERERGEGERVFVCERKKPVGFEQPGSQFHQPLWTTSKAIDVK